MVYEKLQAVMPVSNIRTTMKTQEKSQELPEPQFTIEISPILAAGQAGFGGAGQVVALQKSWMR